MDKSINLAEAGYVIGKKEPLNLKQLIDDCINITVPPNIKVEMPESFP